MRALQKDGKPLRMHLQNAADRGHKVAIEELNGPPFPDALTYIWDWWTELDAGRGEGMHGLAPVTWLTIDAWRRLTDRDVQPHEVTALLVLDAVIRHPPKEGK